jgi:hypothetical protein
MLMSLLLLLLQGWIDTIYMNPEGTFRLARGNKGTLFIRKSAQNGSSVQPSRVLLPEIAHCTATVTVHMSCSLYGITTLIVQLR